MDNEYVSRPYQGNRVELVEHDLPPSKPLDSIDCLSSVSECNNIIF